MTYSRLRPSPGLHRSLLVACIALGLGASLNTHADSAASDVAGASTRLPSTGSLSGLRNSHAAAARQTTHASNPHREQLAARFRSSLETGTSATLRVANCNASGEGSLSAVVAIAQDHDVVDMSELSCSVITLDEALNIPQNNLTLVGDGSTYIVGDGGASGYGVLRHLGNGTLKLFSLDVSYGHLAGVYLPSAEVARGGCVFSNGTVDARNVITKNCSASDLSGSAFGGAIYAQAGVLLIHSIITGADVGGFGVAPSTISAQGGGIFTPGGVLVKYSSIYGNSAQSNIDSAGGGLVALGGGTIFHSTISGNNARSVAGLFIWSNAGEPIDLFSNTVSGNTAYDTSSTAGALLGSSGRIEVKNNTITLNDNYSDSGAGLAIASNPSEFVLSSNLISGNLFQGSLASDFVAASGVTASGDHNLIGWVDPGTFVPADTIRQINAPLGPLFFHGGPTRTHVPLTGNWAFNLGAFPADAIPHIDQNGRPRKVGAGVDIGSHESDALFLGRFEDPPTSLP